MRADRARPRSDESLISCASAPSASGSDRARHTKLGDREQRSPLLASFEPQVHHARATTPRRRRLLTGSCLRSCASERNASVSVSVYLANQGDQATRRPLSQAPVSCKRRQPYSCRRAEVRLEQSPLLALRPELTRSGVRFATRSAAGQGEGATAEDRVLHLPRHKCPRIASCITPLLQLCGSQALPGILHDPGCHPPRREVPRRYTFMSCMPLCPAEWTAFWLYLIQNERKSPKLRF